MIELPIEPTQITWILVFFGVITLLPLLVAQLTILIKPDGQRAKDILIGKGEDWRDKTHFRSAYGFAWADWVMLVPFGAAGSIGVLLGQPWGPAGRSLQRMRLTTSLSPMYAQWQATALGKYI